MTLLADKARAFLALHGGPKILVLPNAWDAGSACVLADAGFPALATTSSGISQSLATPDGERIGRDAMLAAVARIVESVDVPVSADLETGYGVAPEAVAETVRAALDAGAIGANLEDGTRDPMRPLFERTLAAERIAAAREAAEARGVPFVINARTDGFLSLGTGGTPALDESLARAETFLKAGADCVFVPGVADAEGIARLARGIDGPLNILAGPGTPPISELEALGVARVSIGGSLARAALAVVKRAAAELQGPGTYGYAEGALTTTELAFLFRRRR